MIERAREPVALPTLGDLFRRTLVQAPGRLALCDPPDKMRVTGSPPRRLTYAEADRAIAALAAHFVAARLPVGAVVALQLPNTVEAVLAVLAASRAGLVAALLPQLWRRADLAAALNRVSARAIVACGRIDGVDHADLAMQAAVEAFSIRHVCGFGADLPDGMVALDAVLAQPPDAPPPVPAADARRPAIITFDETAEGSCAVPRSHAALIAGGLAVDATSGLPPQAAIVTAALPSSFGALAAALVPWLLTGGTLTLHHPLAPDVLARQLAEAPCDVLVAPALLALELADRGPASRVVGLWRAPERIAASAPWTGAAGFTDVALFGEIGLAAGRRGVDGLPRPLGPPCADEMQLTAHGTLALGGPMVPAVAYHGAPPDEGGRATVVDTGYAAQRTPDGGLTVTAPPAGLVSVGGYRFRLRDLDTWGRLLPADTTLTAVPDRLLGHRLAGHAADRTRTRDALTELGLNPLIADAFRRPGAATFAPDVDANLTGPAVK